MKLAAGYVRCSTDEQGSTSIPQQKEEIQKWAVKNEFEVIEWYVDEGKSGTSFDKRPDFMRLVKVVEGKPAFKFVLVYDESRWGRAPDPRESNYWKTHFDRQRVKVLIINSGSKGEDNISSFIIEVVETAEAGEFSKKLSRTVLRGMLSPQQGKYSRGGTAPYGYKRVAVDVLTGERRDLRPGVGVIPRTEKAVFELGDPLEVNTVKRIFELKASGMGYIRIADKLNEDGIPSPMRGRWRNKDKKWSGCTVRTILTNPTYLGMRIYNRLTFSKYRLKEKGVTEYNRMSDRPKVKNDKSEWIMVPSAHPAIVTEELYNRANIEVRRDLTINGKRLNQHFYNSQYLLTGLIVCKHCGFHYQGARHNKTGNRYYVDGGFTNKGNSVCKYHSVRQDVLEGFVMKSIKELLLAPEMIKKIEDELRGLHNTEQSSSNVERREVINSQIKDIDARIGNLVSMAEVGVNLDSVKERIKQHEETKKHLQAEVEGLQIQPTIPLDVRESVAEAVKSFLINFEERFETVSIPEKKELIKMVVEKIVVDREGQKIDCYIRSLPTINDIEKIGGDNYWVKGVAPTGIEPVFEP